MSIILFTEVLETSVLKFKKATDQDLAAAYRRKLLTMMLADYSNDTGEFYEPTSTRLAMLIDANMEQLQEDWTWLRENHLIEETYPKSYLLDLRVLNSASASLASQQGGR